GFLRGRAETVRQRGRGRIPLGCYHTGPLVGFFIESIVMAPRRAVLAAAFAVLQEIISETAALLRGNPGVRSAGSLRNSGSSRCSLLFSAVSCPSEDDAHPTVGEFPMKEYRINIKNRNNICKS